MFDITTVAAAIRSLQIVPLQSDSGVNPLVPLFIVGFGLLLVYGGFRKWQQRRLIEDTPTEKVRSAAVGRTELSGTVEPIDGVGTLEQPFTDGQALVATYEVEEWREDHDDNSRWETIERDTRVTPFELDDGTGRMRVEPESDATIEISDGNTTQFRVGANETPPDEVVAFFEREYGADEDAGLVQKVLQAGPGARDSDRRRYTQEVIPPGEDVYLLGGARPADGARGSNAERLVLGHDEGSGEFIISDMGESEIVSGYKWAAPAMMAGGIALGAVGVYLFFI